jgi:glycosyltransferase involved in cell wall biosynthesis
MNSNNIKIFIISYNRLNYLKKLIDFLILRKNSEIIIVDNNSTYPPLIKYLESLPLKVIKMKENLGHLVVWNCGLFDDILNNEYYIVSDSDVLPDSNTPNDFINHFYEILQRYPNITKVGFSLRIDDIPDSYGFKKKVIEWEKHYWEKEIEPNVYECEIDTTFAMYRPGIYPDKKEWWLALRTGFPYVSQHLTWYEDSLNISEESNFYQSSLNQFSSEWSITDISLLKEENTMLKKRIKEVEEAHNKLISSNLYKKLVLIINIINYFKIKK